MSTNTVLNNENAVIVGGWSAYHPLTANDKAVFDQAMNGFVGVSYTPNVVSSQVVAGTNYRFKCTASMPPADVVWEAIVEIFQPLNGGKPYVTGIVRI
ncbi:hypothetical protein [Flavobacterium pedocola]